MKVLKWKKAPRKITMALHLITEHDLQQLRRRCDPGPEVWCPFRSRSSTVSTLPLNVFIFSDASSLASQLHSQNNHLVNFLSVGILSRFISIWIICFILCILRHSKASFREGSKYFFHQRPPKTDLNQTHLPVTSRDCKLAMFSSLSPTKFGRDLGDLARGIVWRRSCPSARS